MKIYSGISAGQVLQRLGKAGATALVCGETTSDGPVYVTLSSRGATVIGWKRRLVGTAKSGGFKLRLTGIPAGGPYRLTLERGGPKPETATVRAFYVGDVWILAGQSNMEGAGRMPSFSKPHPLVRAMSQRRDWRRAEDPLHINKESPDACHNYGSQITPDQSAEWHRRASVGAGAGVSFGREMVKRTGVPQGLICTARGGSSMSLWDTQKTDQLYASMLASARSAGQPVAGVLWYQGESDTGEPGVHDYTSNMQALVAAARRDLRQPRLPWVIVQLARVARTGDGRWWNSIQEQQRVLPAVIPHLQVVAAIDLSLDDEIHVGAADMPRLGSRLAHAVSHLTAGQRVEPTMPRLLSVRRSMSTAKQLTKVKCGIDVRFEGIVGGLRSDGEASGFYLIGPDGVELPWIYKTKLHGDAVRLHIMRLPPPGSTVGYGHGFFPRCPITDGRDLALPVFAPVPIAGEGGTLPFITTWRVHPLVSTKGYIDEVRLPKLAGDNVELKTCADGFINQNAAWQGKNGHAFFSAELELDRAQTVQLLMGYDGPFRLWLDGRSVFCNPAGANPCIADESGHEVRLSAGRHELVVGMDIAYGRSWGFFLRLRISGAINLADAGVSYLPTA